MGEQGEIIVFRTNKIPKADQVKLSRTLYGYVERSFHSKYTYRREGVLEKIPHMRPLEWRAVVVTRKGDARKVIQLLEKYGAQIYARRILLEEEDLRVLRGSIEGTANREDAGKDAGDKAQEDQ